MNTSDTPEVQEKLESVEVVKFSDTLEVLLIEHSLENVGETTEALASATHVLVEAVGATKEERSEIQNTLNLLTNGEVPLSEFDNLFDDNFLYALSKKLYGTGKLILLIDTADDDKDSAAKFIKLEQEVVEGNVEASATDIGKLTTIVDALREEKMIDQIDHLHKKIINKTPTAVVAAIVGRSHASLVPRLFKQLS